MWNRTTLELYFGVKNHLRYLSGVALGYGLDDRGYEFRQGPRIFLFTTVSGMALGPTQPPIQWVPGAISLGVNRLGVKLTTHLHLLPKSKKEWSCISTPPIHLHGVMLS
jgi:hypothetical protein